MIDVQLKYSNRRDCPNTGLSEVFYEFFENSTKEIPTALFPGLSNAISNKLYIRCVYRHILKRLVTYARKCILEPA